MNKKWGTILIIIIILVFAGYIVFDVAFNEDKSRSSDIVKDSTRLPDMWYISRTFETSAGKLKAIAVSGSGNIIIGGESFVISYDTDFEPVWTLKTEKPITALSVAGDTTFAATGETIYIIDKKGEVKDEWGPFEDNSIITSVASNSSYVAVADAANKVLILLDRRGNIKSIIGKTGEPFIVPSPYFDVALNTDNTIFVANTGNRRIETRNISGTLLGYFGEPGLAPGAFCGCCNPAHFAIIPEGFVTAEKGLNRIKIIGKKGEFIEFVSSDNKYLASIPLDVASYEGKVVYAANPADSRVYVFRRK
jgi:DNA-binding beta-propeller fold protein YncE